MGQHYVPRYYLKGFTLPNDSDRIWVYERGKDRGYIAGLKRIANENHFYPEEIEEFLANEVEEPANSVIEKIRDGKPISSDEKTTLAKYMMVMWKRVPNQKKWSSEKTSLILENSLDAVENELNVLAEENPEKIDVIRKREAELAQLRTDEKKKEEMIYDTWVSNLSPESTPQSVHALSLMKRCYWLTEGEPFITSDNPLFFFTQIGIGKQKSEVSFPISKSIALWATWRVDLEEGKYIKAHKQVIREINRRTIDHTCKYVYSSTRSDWIFLSMNKKRRRLNRII